WLASSLLRSLSLSFSWLSWSRRAVSAWVRGARWSGAITRPGGGRGGGCERGSEVLELGGDQLVLAGLGGGEHGAPAGGQLAGIKQRRLNLVEHERVELVGADVALGVTYQRKISDS